MAGTNDSTATAGAPFKAGTAQGITVVAGGFLPLLAVLTLPPVLPGMVAAFRDVPDAATTVPIAVAVPGLLVACLSWFAGSLIDRRGRRGPYLVATAFYVLFGLLPVAVPSFAGVVASRIGVGIAQTVVMVVSNALLTDYFPERERRTWLTVQGVSSAILAPLVAIAAGTLGTVGWQYAFALFAIAIPIWFSVLLFCVEPPEAPRPAVSAAGVPPFPVRLGAIVAIVSLIASIVFFVFLLHAGIVLAAIGLDTPDRVGRFIALTTLGGPVGVVVFNLLSRRVSVNWVLGTLVLLMSIGTLGIGLSHDGSTMLGFGFVQQVGGGMAIPSLIYWVAHLVQPAHRGRAFGIFNGSFFLGQFLCAPILGATAGIAGGTLPAFVAIGVIGIALTVVIVVISRPRTATGGAGAAIAAAPDRDAARA